MLLEVNINHIIYICIYLFIYLSVVVLLSTDTLKGEKKEKKGVWKNMFVFTSKKKNATISFKVQRL